MQCESESDQLRGAQHSITNQSRNNKKFRQSSWWMFNGISCCFYINILILLFLPEIYSIHRSLHITFNSIRLHDHQLPEKKYLFSLHFYTLFLQFSKRACQRQKNNNNERSNACILFYVRNGHRIKMRILLFCIFVVKPAFFLSLFFTLLAVRMKLVTRR